MLSGGRTARARLVDIAWLPSMVLNSGLLQGDRLMATSSAP